MFLSLFFLSSIIIYNLCLYSKLLENEPFTNVTNGDTNVTNGDTNVTNGDTNVTNINSVTDKVYFDNITKDNVATANKNTSTSIILLGDSILKNNAYVNPNYSVEYLFKKLWGKNMYCLAKDRAGIKAVYKQLAKIPDRLNTAECVIILSIGGNDLLEKSSRVESLFLQYEQLVRDIKKQFNKCKIILMNLYIPPSMQNNMVLRYKIIQWNNLLKTYTLKKHIDLIPLDMLMNEPIDFVEQYEPSEVGGVKIVKAIMSTV